jgi:hypothetical protein
MRKLLTVLLVATLIFPIGPVPKSMAASPQGSPAPNPVANAVTGYLNQNSSQIPSPSSGAGGVAIPPGQPSDATSQTGCAAGPIMNAMAAQKSHDQNMAGRGISKNMSVLQVLAQQLDVCSQNFLKFALGLAGSTPTWSLILDEILGMACSMVGQVVYDALMCLINGALGGALQGKPFGFCGGEVVNMSVSGGLGVNPQTGQLQLQGSAGNNGNQISGSESANITPNVGTATAPVVNNSNYGAGTTYQPLGNNSGTSGSYSSGYSGTTNQQVGPSDGVGTTLKKLFQ